MQTSQDHQNSNPQILPRTLRTNCTDLERCPALHQAAWEGDLALLERLLIGGEDPDTGDEWNLTPIMSTLMRYTLQDTRCVFRDREPIQRNIVMDCREEDAKRVAKSRALLTLFFRFGANLDALSNTGKTALHYVTSDGLYEAAEILLDAGATVDIQDQYGQSPLHSAVKERSLLVTNLLVSRGASIDLQDAQGDSPLSLVIRKGFTDMMQIFLNQHALVSTRGRLNFAGAVLLEAVEVEAVEIIRLLVEGGYASLDYQNDEGETAMHLAIAKGSIPMVEALGALDTAGLSLYTVTNCGDSCFHFAARFAAAHELEVLLNFWRQRDVDDRGAVLDKPDASGATPLFVAATATDSNGEFGDRHEKMELLLANGATLFHSGALAGDFPLCWGAGVVLPIQVQRCLTQWLVECRTEGDGHFLHSFCRKWITGVPVKADTTNLMSTLVLAVCAGYTVDVLPLLVTLPQKLESVTSFLESLEVFMRGPNSLQFRCLVRELDEACK